jgi:hypothetical protein
METQNAVLKQLKDNHEHLLMLLESTMTQPNVVSKATPKSTPKALDETSDMFIRLMRKSKKELVAMVLSNADNHPKVAKNIDKNAYTDNTLTYKGVKATKPKQTTVKADCGHPIRYKRVVAYQTTHPETFENQQHLDNWFKANCERKLNNIFQNGQLIK